MVGVQVLKSHPRIWLVVLTVLAFLITATAASADSGQVRFQGNAAVRSLQVLGTTSTFDYAKDGSISKVQVSTLGEIVFADDLNVDCRPRKSAACAALTGASITDTHTSQEVLRDVSVVPNPFSLVLGLGDFGAIAGKLSGELTGSLLLSSPGGSIPGTLQMKIRGTATLSCVIPNPLGSVPPVVPVPVAACEDRNGDGQPDLGGFLIPVVFDVDDQGRFELGAGVGAYDGVTGGEGRIRAQVAGTALGQTGTIVIPEGTLSTAAGDGDADNDKEGRPRRRGEK